SIISLNFRKPDLTLVSLKSLFSAYKKQFEENIFEYIVVDNHSEDNSAEILKKEVKKYPNFNFIESPLNNGFGAGNNLGSRKAKGEYLLFLNNDTKITGSGIADMLSYATAHPEIAILGGQLLNFDETPQVSTGPFYTLFPLLFLLLGMQRFGGGDKNPADVQKVDWVKGALFMIKKDVFEKLHGFDERIFMYTEDMELCFRAKKMGYDTYFYPTKGILHKDQGSSGRTFAIVHIYKNLLYFYQKHMPRWQISIAKLLLQTKAIFLIVYGKAFKKPYFVETYEKAFNVVR
ncbi:MAG TPA: glycosyltransferase family 2 protein, partial [Candidatus Saccharimonadales bacterium]|nr:glycosyltransferase family 2 protein [Candidatus Saccharimonadales bacterium]